MQSFALWGEAFFLGRVVRSTRQTIGRANCGNVPSSKRHNAPLALRSYGIARYGACAISGLWQSSASRR